MQLYAMALTTDGFEKGEPKKIEGTRWFSWDIFYMVTPFEMGINVNPQLLI